MEALILHQWGSTVDTHKDWSKTSKLNIKWLCYQGDWWALPSALSGGRAHWSKIKTNYNSRFYRNSEAAETPTWSQPVVKWERSVGYYLNWLACRQHKSTKSEERGWLCVVFGFPPNRTFTTPPQYTGPHGSRLFLAGAARINYHR